MNVPPSPTELLVAAIRANNVHNVRDVLQRVPDVRRRINDALPGLAFGATPLIAALEHGNTELLQLLLDAGADINARSAWWAGGFGVLDHDHDLAPWLIERGARVDAHAAARLGMLDTLTELVAADATRVHARGGDGQTPLHVASSVEIAQFLLDHGADINALDVDHESTPAQYMIRDRTSIARHLVEQGAKTDLFLVAALGDAARVRATLDAHPASVQETIHARWFPRQNPRASLPIYAWTLGMNKSAHAIAREFGHEPIVTMLMERSPDAIRLAVACEFEDRDLLAQLLANGAALPAPLSVDLQARMVAMAERNGGQAVRLMLSTGWPPDSRTESGITALHFAAWHGNADLVVDLLRAGASPALRESEHDGTARHWAEHGAGNSWFRATGDYAATMAALDRAT